jgi:DNA-3-methyladenine glycosylase I
VTGDGRIRRVTGEDQSRRATGDGRIRCLWAAASGGPDQDLMRDYHDLEWGRPLRGRAEMFERMTLEAFQSGLSWLIILRKRDNFRRAFAGFDVDTVARYTAADVDRLMSDSGIVRNRAKIEATVTNARVAADLDVDLADLLWGYAPPPRRRHAAAADVPARSAESVAMARDLKRLGFRFVGPTTAYALMQATGMVDDHTADCWLPRRFPTLAADREQWR